MASKKGRNPLYSGAVSRADSESLAKLSEYAGKPNPLEVMRAKGHDTAVLDNPEMFATAPGHFDKSLMDMPLSDINAMYKDHPEGLPVSGDDISKMGDSNLRPGATAVLRRTTSDRFTTPHIYVTAPSDRANNPNRRLDMEDPNKGTD